MEALYKEVGERIRLERDRQGYTREELAELADISAKYLYEIEHGKRGFSVLILCNLCRALRVDYECLLVGRGR